MEFVSTFLDLNTWITLINAILLPFQTLATTAFNLLPTLLGLFNDFLVMLSDIAEVLVDFFKKAFTVCRDLFYSTVFEMLETVLDLLIRFITWVADGLEWFFDLFGKKNAPGGDGYGGGGMGSR